MGVTGLWKLVEPSGKPIPLETLENKVVAVDISIWLHQVIKGFQDARGATIANAHLLGLFQRLCKLLYYRIKPIFVFDGSVPVLKRETMRKRQQNKNKYNSEADKLQQLLLQTLAKEKVVQQALGQSASSLLLASPIKEKPNSVASNDDDMFKLPANLSTDTTTSLDQSADELDNLQQKKSTRHSHMNINSIDVTNDKFKALPADIRHDILTEIKETRKESSWGRLHELPVDSDDFSSFQMKRLIKRRQVQMSLESAEKEMGGKSLSLLDLERLLTEEGIVDVCSKEAKRIASDENSYFYYVNDLNEAKKSTEESLSKVSPSLAKKPKLSEETVIAVDENDDADADEDGSANGDIKEVARTDVDDEENDEELQKAILLSLEQCDANIESNESDAVKLSREQKEKYGNAAKGLARDYMIEYGGMNSDDVANLIDCEQHDESNDSFKYNQSLMKQIPEEILNKIDSPIQIDTDTDDDDADDDVADATADNNSISSGADSDFVEVPDINGLINNSIPSSIPLQMNEQPAADQTKDFRLADLNLMANLEVIIDCNAEKKDDDLFADVFNISNEMKKEEIGVIDEKLEHKNEKSQNCETADVDRAATGISNETGNLLGILNDLNSHLKTVLETGLNLNDIAVDEKPMETEPKKVEIIETSVEKTTNLKNILLDLDNDLQRATNPDSIAAILDTQTAPESMDKNLIIEILDDENEGAMKTPTKTMKQVDINFYMKQNSDERPTQFIIEEKKKAETPESPKVSPSIRHRTKTAHSPNAEDKLKATKQLVLNEMAQSTEATNQQAIEYLREMKTTEQLTDIATEIQQEKIDLEYERNKLNRLGVSISDRICTDCKELLKLFGIPFIVAPQEAEAQCAYLNEINLTDGTITDDSDIWLFGGKTVYKNFFNQQKTVMEFRAENIQRYFNVDREKLIQLSILVGSDYTCGISGIGAVTALEILASFKSTSEETTITTKIMSILSGLRRFREWWEGNRNTEANIKLRNKLRNISLTEDFPSRRVVEAYLYPEIDSNSEKFTWGYPDANTIREFAKNRLGWTTSKTDELLLPVLRKIDEKTTQQTIRDYFQCQRMVSNAGISVSKRVKKAIEKMSTNDDVVEVPDETIKRPKRSTKTKLDNAKEKKATGKKRGKAQQPPQQTDEPQPSTSSSIVNGKIPNIPDPNPVIPQRIKDKETFKRNKEKAINLMKNLRKSNRKTD